MAALTAARNISRRTLLLRRHVSSTPSSAPPTFSLPPSKLRALISLYHQSGQFITPKSLDKAIDNAFTEKETALLRAIPYVVGNLKAEVSRRRSLPKFGQVDEIDSSEEGMSEEKNRRVSAVFEALYGTQAGRNPGLEVLQDTWASNEQRLQEAESEIQEAESETKPAREQSS
ncbi:hypothetical protein EW146_g7521 [Bondarzewia mesenterica]|uniref:Uncharacterized protein n=1 Tax=Bondarzewia mesenterica TaxID=1095465 RepID=A0A4S4LKJ1_9AGAM|nr:hypothetical protein EW146_g7521 [Bondarzewia mesenterica]